MTDGMGRFWEKRAILIESRDSPTVSEGPGEGWRTQVAGLTLLHRWVRLVGQPVLLIRCVAITR